MTEQTAERLINAVGVLTAVAAAAGVAATTVGALILSKLGTVVVMLSLVRQ